MAQWYEVFNKATGEVVSVGTVIADAMPAHLGSRMIPPPEDKPPPPVSPLVEIKRLEDASQARALREYFLTGSKTDLQALETKITALRAKIK